MQKFNLQITATNAITNDNANAKQKCAANEIKQKKRKKEKKMFVRKNVC